MRRFYSLLVGLSALQITFAADQFQLEEATIESVRQAIHSEKITCEALVNQTLDRIRTYNIAFDKKAPINAFSNINPSVLDEARALDQQFKKTHELKGPLHCVTVIVKDNIDTYDSPSSSGSLSLLGQQPVKDAFLVKQLRDAGAIILGKGAMDEFASGFSGISSLNGRTGNAYDSNQNPGGSSSGVAAAVSANFAMVGIGTDNSGSVRLPAAFNGVVGLRPSTGEISRQGIFPRGNLDGMPGPIARNAHDLAIVMSVIAKADKQDKNTLKERNLAEYQTALEADGLKNKTIGIVRRVGERDVYSGVDDEAKKLFDETIKRLQASGANIVDDINFSEFDAKREGNMAGEIQEVDAYLASFPSVRKNFQAICKSGRTPVFGDLNACLAHIRDTAQLNSSTYQLVLKRFNKNRTYVEEIMKNKKMDALIVPISTSGVATYDGKRVNTWQAPLSSNSGLPAITINAGYAKNGMPVAMQLIGKYSHDAELVAMVNTYEKIVGSRNVPVLYPIAKDSEVRQMSIPELNNFFNMLGYAGYEKVLRNKKENNFISATQFQNITKDVLKMYD